MTALLRRLHVAAVSVLLCASCHALAGLDGVGEVDGSGGSGAGAGSGGSAGGGLPNGEGCQNNGACESGFCVDDVCCAVACEGACQVCDGGVAGSCEPLPLAATPGGSCEGACDGAGQCLTGAPQDARVLAGSGNQHISSVLYDDAGNLLIAGVFENTVDFGDGDVTSSDDSVFVVKYGSDGTLLWKTFFPGQGMGATARQIMAFDSQGDIIVAGTYGTTLTIGVQSFQQAMSPRNVYLAKLSGMTGAPLTSTSLQSNGQQYVAGLVVTEGDEISLLAGFQGAAWTFENVVLAKPTSGHDIAIVRVAANLSVESSVLISGTGNHRPRDLVADAAGNVVFTAVFDDSLSLPGIPAMEADGNDVIVAKLNANGTVLCSNRFGSGPESEASYDFDEPFKVRLDSKGNMWVLGLSDWGFEIGNGMELPFGGSVDAWLIKLSPDCVLQDAFNIGNGPDIEKATGLALDAADNIVVSYEYTESVLDLGGGPLTTYGLKDVVLAKFAPDGTHLWSAAYGTLSDEYLVDVALDSQGNIAVAGQLQATFNIGDNALVSNEFPSNSFDAFVATFAP